MQFYKKNIYKPFFFTFFDKKVLYFCAMDRGKFYVVWRGRQVGVFSSWESCKMQIEGFKGAQYKSFPDRMSAEKAFEMGYEASKTNNNVISYEMLPDNERPIGQSIAVDAACSGNPGKVEYQGVFVETKTNLFKSPVFEGGTNNIGEFLAIVHCLSWQQKKRISYPIYTDSINAMKWVSEGSCRTKIAENANNAYLFSVIRRAEKWLRENSFRVPIYKWKTEKWGEIPADFGRK